MGCFVRNDQSQFVIRSKKPIVRAKVNTTKPPISTKNTLALADAVPGLSSVKTATPILWGPSIFGGRPSNSANKRAATRLLEAFRSLRTWDRCSLTVWTDMLSSDAADFASWPLNSSRSISFCLLVSLLKLSSKSIPALFHCYSVAAMLSFPDRLLLLQIAWKRTSRIKLDQKTELPLTLPTWSAGYQRSGAQMLPFPTLA